MQTMSRAHQPGVADTSGEAAAAAAADEDEGSGGVGRRRRASPTRISSIIFLAFACSLGVRADDTAGEGVHPVTDPSQGFHIGDTCVESCSMVISNSFCNQTTNTCQCLPTHPIVIEEVDCVAPAALDELCIYDQQCYARNRESYCFSFSDGESRCSCKPGYHTQEAFINSNIFVCETDNGGPLTRNHVPAIVALGIGLTVLVILLCLLLRIFSRAHFNNSRNYSRRQSNNRSSADRGRNGVAGGHIKSENSHLNSRKSHSCAPPPEIMLQGDVATDSHQQNVDLEKQLYRPAVYSCASAAAAAAASAAATASSTSRNNSLTGGASNHSYSSGAGDQQYLGPRRVSGLSGLSGLSGFSGQFHSEWPEGFTDTDSNYEQQITIVPNPRAKRRCSMADYAFPELHPRSKGGTKEPENLLILTRTRTDRHGRRHSVAVPLVPPPDGERFEGGYYVERNPITGGAKLVTPSGEVKALGEKPAKDKSPSGSHHQNYQHQRGSSARERSTGGSFRRETKKSTKGGNSAAASAHVEKSQIAPEKLHHQALANSQPVINSPPATAASTTPPPASSSTAAAAAFQWSRKSSRYRNRTIASMPTIGEKRQANHISGKRDQEPEGANEVPGQSGHRGRRHSLQVHRGGGSSGTNQLARDMERLRVGNPGHYGHSGRSASQNPSPGGASPRPLKRKGSSRRSSRSGFLHFLDLAIAN